MAVPWQVMNKMRSKIKSIINFDSLTPCTEEERRIWGDKIKVDDQLMDDRFYTYDYDNGQIVTNFKTQGVHYIFDLEGNLLKKHTD